MKKEVFSLYIVQLANMIVPILVFPYFVKILGIEGMGKIGFSQTLIMLFSFIIDFGFNLSGARTVSIYEQQGKSYHDVYSNILIFKFLLFLMLTLACLFITFFLPITTDDLTIIWLTLLASLSSVLIPNFIFNALSINSKLAIITLIIRIISLLPIFILVKQKQDYLLAIGLQILPSLIVGFCAQFYLIQRLKVKFSFTYYQKKLLIEQVKDAFHNFSASFLTFGFTYGIPLFIKASLGDAALGIYTLVDKIIMVLRQLYNPIVQAFYAKVCILYEQQNWLEYKKLLTKITLIFLVIGLTAWFGNFLVGGWLLKLIFGTVEKLSFYLNIAIITQIIISLAIILVNFYILPSNQAYVLKKFYAIGFLLFLPVMYILQYYLKLTGFFVSMLIIEGFITLLLLQFFYKATNSIVKISE